MDLGNDADPRGCSASPALLPVSSLLQKLLALGCSPESWTGAGAASSASPVSHGSASRADVGLTNRALPLKHIPGAALEAWFPLLGPASPLAEDNVSEGDNESIPSSSSATLMLWVLPADTNCCPWLPFKGL